MNNEDIARVFARIDILREEGKLPQTTQEDIENEPTALAFTHNNQFHFSDEIENSYLNRFIEQFGDGVMGELDPKEWDVVEFLEWLKLNNFEIIKK